jgi:hypothetical protein
VDELDRVPSLPYVEALHRCLRRNVSSFALPLASRGAFSTLYNAVLLGVNWHSIPSAPTEQAALHTWLRLIAK